MLTRIGVFISLLFAALNAASLEHNNNFERSQWVEALNGEQRSAAHAMRDSYRHPYQTLMFFGLKPSDHVIEIWPGGAGWYTEILAPLLSQRGKLTVAHFRADSAVEYFARARKNFNEKLAKHPKIYNKLALSILQPPNDFKLAEPGSVDKVLTFRNIHNWMKSGHDNQVFDAMFAALKPGGMLGVVEHRAIVGTPLEAMINSGYVTEQYVKQLAERSGFKFVGSSDVNGNIKDSTLHAKGVWTLPPSLRLGDYQREQYRAIGESDRMTLKFIKPKL